MRHTKVCTRFKFESKGITKNATFSGPVVLLPEGLFLAAKGVTTESANAAAAMFGLLGALLASLFSSLDKIEFPYPAVTCNDLPEQVRNLEGFGKLKEKHRIVIVKREQILGYTSSFFKPFTLICAGEDVVLLGPRKKLISVFSEYGYAEHKPEGRQDG